MKISFVIVTWNCLRQIQECLRTLKELNIPDSEIIVVDANSHDGTSEYLDIVDNIRLHKVNYKDTWSYNNLLGISMSKGDWICVMNPDIYFNNSFNNTLEVLENVKEPYPIITPQLVYPNMKNQDGFPILRFEHLMKFCESSYILFKMFNIYQSEKGILYPNNNGYQLRKVFHPRGSMFIIHRNTISSLGQLWHDKYTLCVADSDMFRRAYENNIDVLLVTSSKIVHEEGHTLKHQSRDKLDTEMMYGLILYARYWKEHPLILSLIYFIDAISPLFIVQLIHILKSKRNRRINDYRRQSITIDKYLSQYVNRAIGKIRGIIYGWNVKL